MKKCVSLLVLLVFAAPLSAQRFDELSFEQAFLLRNASGTAANPGPAPHYPRLITRGAWTTFLEGSAHATYVSESGPAEQRNEVFSTNWLSAGAQRQFGSRAMLLVRGRVSAEPVTIPDEGGYPQILQWISAENGGPHIDRMPPHDWLQEAAVHLAFRTFGESYLHLYGAAVGDPALGPVPYAVRASAFEFAEAPFAYDVQETFQTSTRVVTVGWSARWLSIEASAFHDSTGLDSVDDGDIDSSSARVTFSPTRNVSIQLSRGELGETNEREITSASASYGTESLAATALWTRRESEVDEPLTSFGFEITFRARRNTFMGRVESVDRPRGYLNHPTVERTTHMAVGYIFDIISNPTWRTGIGFNFDYHTQTHELEEIYGHKPQAIYTFVRIRTN